MDVLSSFNVLFLKESFMKINQLKAGAILSYLSMGLGLVVSILFTPIMLRLLGRSEYGLYNLVSSVVSYLGLLKFGFGSAYMRYFSRYRVKDDQKGIATLNGMFLVVFSVIGLIAAAAGFILAQNTEIIFGSKLTLEELATARILMMILVVNLAVSFPNIVFSSYMTANEDFIFQRLLQIVKVVVSPLVTLPVLIMGFGSVGMVAVTTLIHVLIEIVNIWYSIRKLAMRFSFHDFDFALLKEMTVFSSFIFINMVTDQINWSVDKFLLGRFHGTIAVAVYGLAAQINSYYKQIGTTISTVFVPRIHKLIASSEKMDELTLLFTRIGRIQFILLSLIGTGLIFFGRPFILKWAGHDYDGSYPILLWLAIPVTIDLIQNIGIEITRAMNMHKFRSIVYLVMAVANLVISIPLTRQYGGVGAAIGTGLSVFIGNGLIMNWYYHARVGLDILFFWKQIARFLPSLIIPTAVGILFNEFFDLNNTWLFLTLGVVYCLIFMASMWFFGMNDYEKNLISKPLRRKFNKRMR